MDKTPYIVNEDVIWTNVEDSGILVHLKSGEYYETNVIGLVILNLLKEQKSLPDIAQAVTQDYDVSSEVVLKDINEMITALLEKDILQKPSSV